MTTFITIGATGGSGEKGYPKDEYWPVKKTHKPAPAKGDPVVLFIGGYAHGNFTAVGELADPNDWKDSEQFGKKRMYRIRKFKPIKPAIPLYVARALFPDWGWCRNARIQTAVEVKNEKLFWNLIQTPQKYIGRFSKRIEKPIDNEGESKTYTATIDRKIRDTTMIKKLRRQYKSRCQIQGCEFDFDIVEGHHVHPYGKHDGPDKSWNVLILCPNHHALFDYLIPEFITTKKVVIGDQTFGLRFIQGHSLDQAVIDFHNKIKFGQLK